MDPYAISCIADNPQFRTLDADEQGEPSLAPSGMFIPPPAYQLEAPSFKLDLSCLTPDAKAAAGAIAAIDSQASEWPLAALRQATTLDDSQLKALQVHSLRRTACECV